MRVEVIQDNGNQGDIIDLPFRDRLPEFAQAVLSGKQYSQSVMVGTGKLFSRPEYDTLIDALVAGGLMRWKNPDHHNIGAVPTLAGKAVLKHYAPSPSPTEDD